MHQNKGSQSWVGRAAFACALLVVVAGWLRAQAAEPVPKPPAHVIQLLSTSDRTQLSATPQGWSGSPRISADGRFVFFLSSALNLDPRSPANGAVSLYRYDRQTGSNVLVSVPPGGADGVREGVWQYDISPDGLRAAFQTLWTATPKPPGRSRAQLLLRDIEKGETITAVADSAAATGSELVTSFSLSNEGLLVETTLPLDGLRDANKVADVYFLRNGSGVFTLVSAGKNGVAVPATNTYGSVISSSGGVVAFVREGADLVTNTLASPLFEESVPKVYFTVVTGEVPPKNTKVPGITGIPLSFSLYGPGVSEEGRYVALAASDRRLFRYDRQSEVRVETAMPTGADINPLDGVQLSRNGERLLYKAHYTITAGGGRAGDGLVLWDLAAGTNGVVSRGEFGTNIVGAISNVRLSPGGKFASYLSDETGAFSLYLLNLDTGARETILPDALPESVAEFGGQDEWLVYADPVDHPEVGDRNAESDVFVRNLSTGAVELVTRRQKGMGLMSGPSGSRPVLPNPWVSSNGRFTLFNSFVPGPDGRSLEALYLADIWTGSNRLVNAAFNGSGPANLGAIEAVASEDGHWVWFTSHATNLVETPPATASALYLRDTWLGSTRLISHAPPGGVPLYPASRLSASGDGTRIAFQLTIPPNSLQRVYYYDTATDSSALVSTSAAWGAKTGIVPRISQDGSKIAFVSDGRFPDATIPSGGACYLFDVSSGGLTLVSTQTVKLTNPSALPALSGDGRVVLHAADSGLSSSSYLITFLETGEERAICTNCSNGALSGDGKYAVYQEKFKVAAGFNQRVVLYDAAANSYSDLGAKFSAPPLMLTNFINPSISADGRFVVFSARALTSANDGGTGALIYDRLSDIVEPVLPNAFAGDTPPLDMSAVVSADGSTVVFEGFSASLNPGDFNGRSDVFAYRVPLGGDLDGNGIDDVWETLNLGRLGNPAAGDINEDGVSDLAQFIAETNANQPLSITRVTIASGKAVLEWLAAPGFTYRVQSRSTLGDAAAWENITEPAVGAGQQTRVELTPSDASQRFYRLVASPLAP